MSSPTRSSVLLLLSTSLLAFSSSALDQEALRKALSGPDREVSDYVRDSVRKPVEVLDFLGIDSGMTVLDLYAAGGYYTFILGKAVGPSGHVFAQNTSRGLLFKEDRQDRTQGEALNAKIIAGNFTNITPLVAPLTDIDLPAESLDAVMAMQLLHDYYNGSPTRALEMLYQIKLLLKPGGIIGISDHVGLAGNDNQSLHRMEIEQAIALAEEAGFIVTSSQLLRNDQDPHNRDIFDPRLGRNTDRFLLKLQKPR